MTALSVNDLNLGTNLEPAVKHQLNRSAPLLDVLDKRIGIDGSAVVWNVEGDGATVRGHADNADFTTETHNEIVRGQLLYVNYDQTIKVGDHTLSAAALSANPAAFEHEFARQLMNSVKAMGLQMQKDILQGTGAGGTSITGLRFGIGGDGDDSEGGSNPTVSYAGISGASKSFWNSTVVHPAGALSKEALHDFFYTIEDASGVFPNVAVCTGDVFKEVIALYESQVRYNGGVSQVGLGNDSQHSVTIDGVNFIRVKAQDGYDGAIYAFNTDSVYLKYRPLLPEPAVIPLGNLPMGMQVVRAAKTGHWKKAVARVSCQLVIEQRNACGKMVDITVS